MRLANFSYIVTGNLVEKKWRTLFAIFVIAFAVIVALAVTALSTGLLRGLQQRAAEMFPPTVVMVKPKTVALAMLAFNSAVIDQAVVDKITVMPGVTKVEPQLSLRVPLRMEVEIAGQYAVTDVVVIGVAPDTVKGSIKNSARFSYDEATSQPIPCVVPRLLLDMYYLAYADIIGFPKINEEYLLGKKFTMVLGGTYLAGGSGDKETKLLCQVVGLVSDPSLVPGVYMPMEYARRINRWYTGNNDQPFTALRVIIDRPDQADNITKALSGMGLLVEGNQWAYESITAAIKISTALLYLFALTILVVTTFSILNLFSLIMAHRLGEIRLLTAVGATRKMLRWIYFSEALAIALAGAVIGLVVAGGVLGWVERMIRSRLESMHLSDLSIVPERIFAFDFLPVTGVILFIILISVAAPLVVTWKTTSRLSSGNGAV
jgi:ABC-type lipoprotein release transport system permease subunit